LISKLDFLLQQGFDQAYQVDKSLLTLSAGALALSLTFVGNLSGTKHYLVLLFVAWVLFTGSIIAVISAMRKAQLTTHDRARETADNLEQFSSLHDALAGIMRATFPVATDKLVARRNRIAFCSFVLGVIFLCLFVGSNLLKSTQLKGLYTVAESRPAILTRPRINSASPDRRFEFQKRSQLFVGAHNKTLSVERIELLGIFHA